MSGEDMSPRPQGNMAALLHQIQEKKESKEEEEAKIQNEWAEMLRQEVYFNSSIFLKKKINKDSKQERALFFAHPKYPRRVYVGIKIKRISDIDNIRETFRCRFHIYMNSLLSLEDYKSYLVFEANKQKNKLLKLQTFHEAGHDNASDNASVPEKENKDVKPSKDDAHLDKHHKHWTPSFRPQFEFLNAVEVHSLEEVPFGDGGLYKVELLKDFDQVLVGFDPNRGYFARSKVEADITFAEELELQNFPVELSFKRFFFFLNQLAGGGMQY
ncbi:hypothetical protein RFI_04395, partial [Reticulomyxa filosa]